jgi:hypothetical protein
MARKKKNNTHLSFFGDTCTKDCSGHLAGWRWRQNHPNSPVIANRSFTEGANKRDQHTAQGKNPPKAVRAHKSGRYTKGPK